MKLINNQDSLLIDEIRDIININSKIYLSCNQFTAFAVFNLLKELSLASLINVLLDDSIEEDQENKYIESSEEKVLNLSLDRRYKVNKVVKLIENKFEIRSGKTSGLNLLIIDNNGVYNCYLLTMPTILDTVSLGTLPSDRTCIINSFIDENEQYIKLFMQAWHNSRSGKKEGVIDHLCRATKDYTGEDIYKYCIRKIFEDTTVGERADEKFQKVGFKDSKVWSLLYNFQKDAVIGAIEKIETFGGCIIADSVGLGKTFEALAVMKYYQLRNDRILVLAPKKLRENWTVYSQNDKRNILSSDRLNYDVLNHTDLSRERGHSGDIDLSMINWGNYDLVVIDESHNFRNNPTRKGITRYKRLMEDVIKSNIRTKVLMLSATPVNNKMNDLKNQIYFITEGKDDAFEEYGIDNIRHLMKESQRRFTDWYKTSDPENLDAQSLMKRLDGRYFKLLNMLTIARSRKHIEKYYDTSDIGKFPVRNIPITVKPGIDIEDKFNDIGQLYDNISSLNLAAYTPLAYVRSDKREYYEAKYDIQTKTGSVFKQVDREQSLIYLMRVNLLKRLESSIHSFRMTLKKLCTFIDLNIERIDNHSKADFNADINITDIEIDDSDLEDLLVGGKTKVLLQDMDCIKWKHNLLQDKEVLESLLLSILDISPKRDAKINKLKSLIEDKISNPINEGNKKVIVFTAFADTANYLYSEFSEWLKEKLGLSSALVTGSGTNKTNMKGCRSDLNSILLNFSPRSKKRDEISPEESNEIDILFCTDCISEGQNLQDCDYLVNYDIHWNPVRIIQRFGRIDRIGSTNTNIQLVNFFPSMELDSFTDLVGRVQGRMVMLDVSATGEDNVISKNNREMQDLEYRKQQLKQLQSQVIDIEDIQGNISISDLSFNDFKMDIEKSTRVELEQLNKIPPASYAVVESNLEQIKPGVIFCMKDKQEDSENLSNNIIYPFFLVYVSMDCKEIVPVRNSKRSLDYFRKLCMGRKEVMSDIVALFEKETKRSKNMSAYKEILDRAMAEIKGVQDEIGLDMLANPGGSCLFGTTKNSKENLDLIAYLIIK
ncbi:MAG: DEAD/DEAH box helicase [Marinifilaceae bacterium]|jgi:SNF2 family DNA or RNA helicase|nr:DEAD/DEAH box helicase [Marinifilaceae bacterium]